MTNVGRLSDSLLELTRTAALIDGRRTLADRCQAEKDRRARMRAALPGRMVRAAADGRARRALGS